VPAPIKKGKSSDCENQRNRDNPVPIEEHADEEKRRQGPHQNATDKQQSEECDSRNQQTDGTTPYGAPSGPAQIEICRLASSRVPPVVVGLPISAAKVASLWQRRARLWTDLGVPSRMSGNGLRFRPAEGLEWGRLMPVPALLPLSDPLQPVTTGGFAAPNSGQTPVRNVSFGLASH
jgi:hypothetical protein